MPVDSWLHSGMVGSPVASDGSQPRRAALRQHERGGTSFQAENPGSHRLSNTRAACDPSFYAHAQKPSQRTERGAARRYSPLNILRDGKAHARRSPAAAALVAGVTVPGVGVLPSVTVYVKLSVPTKFGAGT